ncbi:MAG: CDP-diacylglycerol--glycerol-3-phosphate 3-phosphatidyltransferase [Actinomycetia bacterium]|nr:CDP-diacylglycerol--glycerol-3-phosphate 3-phosphatidyltransferase [Actinomycetes bacterium]
MVEIGSVMNLANALTLTRLFASPVFIVMVTESGPRWLTFFVGAAIALTDAADGWLARRYGSTASGAFLDPLVDKVFVLGGMYALVAIDQFHWFPVTLIAVRELAMSLYRSTVGRTGVSVPASSLAKIKTTVQIWALGFALIPPVAENVHWIATTTLWSAVALTYVTGAQYYSAARKGRPDEV